MINQQKNCYFLILLTTSLNLNASGFAIKENSASLQGAAFANASTWNDDISGMRANPALIGHFNKKKQTVLGVNYVMPRIQLDNIHGTEPNNINSINNATQAVSIPDSFTSLPVNDHVVLGFALTSPWGLSTQYPKHWPGEYHAVKTELKTYNANPVIAYNINDKLSIAAGLQIQFMQAHLIQSLSIISIPNEPPLQANIKGNNIALGSSLGLFYQIDNNNKLGFGYQSEIREHLKGSMAAIPPVLNDKSDVRTDITTPEIVNVGLSHKVNSNWDLYGNIEWTHWSSFKQMIIHTDIIDLTFDENWRNTFYYSLGSNYRYSKHLNIRTGLGYDESPVPNSTRSPRTPDNNRLWTSIGLGYQVSDNINLDFGYTHIFMKNSTIDLNTDNSGALYALNRTNADVLSTALTWTF